MIQQKIAVEALSVFLIALRGKPFRRSLKRRNICHHCPVIGVEAKKI
jgi:hypothetical protein